MTVPRSRSKNPKSYFMKLTSQILSLTSLTPTFLSRKDGAEVDFALSDADSAAVGDRAGAIMEGTFQFPDAPIGARRRRIEFCGILHANRLVWSFLVIDFNESIKLTLLLKRALSSANRRRKCGGSSACVSHRA